MTRLEELQQKSSAGKITPKEFMELKNLGAEPASPLPTASGSKALGIDQTIKTEDQIKKNMQDTAQSTITKINPKKPIKGLDTSTNTRDPVVPGKVEQSVIDKDKVDELTAQKLEHIAAGDFPGEKAVLPEPTPTPTPEPAPVVDTTPAPVSAPPVSAPPEVQEPIVSDTMEAPAIQTPAVGEMPDAQIASEVLAPEDKKSGFGNMLKELAGKYGVPMLEILQAVGYQRGGINKPTLLEKRYEQAIADKERAFMTQLEKDKLAAEDVAANKRLKLQQEFEAQENAITRLAEKQARGEELSSREKIALMSAEAVKAARAATAADKAENAPPVITPSLLPE